MALIKFELFKELETLHDRMQRYFDDFPNFGFNVYENFYPRIDISEDKDNINVIAEIPGIKKDEIKITLQDNILTIEGEKKKESEQKEKNFFRSERIYGFFKRCFTLPELVDSEKVEAKFEDGMLNIQLKKIEQKVKSEKVIELK
ncbi:MAG: Hsp20/alpha crystallin family protein [Ignavibacteriales bacterium]|nr:MAG: Hsp20/alpha crystallin family protein [Ignavibacteriales bacterium]